MSRIISVVNQKGGVGKTTTAINLGAYLANLGKFVLLIDMDPQANATSGLGIKRNNLVKGIYNVLIDSISLNEVIVNTPHQGCKITPSTPDLAGARVELVNLEDREYKLYQALLEVRNDYDFIIIDCPPSLDLLTVNGLVAADEVLIPVQSEYYALEGLGQLLETINLVKNNLRPELNVLGAVITMFDKRNKLSHQVIEDLKNHFPYKIFNTIIPRNIKLTESPSFGQAILSYDPTCKGAKAYEDLAKEIIVSQMPIVEIS